MASDGREFFPLLGLSEDSNFQALALKLKQKMRLSQLHSLIEPSVARRKEGLCLCINSWPGQEKEARSDFAPFCFVPSC